MEVWKGSRVDVETFTSGQEGFYFVDVALLDSSEEFRNIALCPGLLELENR